MLLAPKPCGLRRKMPKQLKLRCWTERGERCVSTHISKQSPFSKAASGTNGFDVQVAVMLTEAARLNKEMEDVRRNRTLLVSNLPALCV